MRLSLFSENGGAFIAEVFLTFIASTIFAVMPWEKRLLEKDFGESYRRYRDTSPSHVPWPRGRRPVRRTP